VRFPLLNGELVSNIPCRHKQSLTSIAANLENAEPWDFSKQSAADLVVINIGTNDQNAHNNVSAQTYQDNLTKLIQGVHGVWPNAQVVLMVSTITRPISRPRKTDNRNITYAPKPSLTHPAP